MNDFNLRQPFLTNKFLSIIFQNLIQGPNWYFIKNSPSTLQTKSLVVKYWWPQKLSWENLVDEFLEESDLEVIPTRTSCSFCIDRFEFSRLCLDTCKARVTEINFNFEESRESSNSYQIKKMTSLDNKRF